MLSMVMQSMLGLAFVLGLFALLVWAARRLNLQHGGSARGDFKIIQRIHIDNKNSIIEVCHKDQHYLLALSPGGLLQLRPDQAINVTKATTEPTTECLTTDAPT